MYVICTGVKTRGAGGGGGVSSSLVINMLLILLLLSHQYETKLQPNLLYLTYRSLFCGENLVYMALSSVDR